ncbi:MAG: hypothetical protein WCL32_05370 [Planctomycetota bacterium]
MRYLGRSSNLHDSESVKLSIEPQTKLETFGKSHKIGLAQTTKPRHEPRVIKRSDLMALKSRVFSESILRTLFDRDQIRSRKLRIRCPGHDGHESPFAVGNIVHRDNDDRPRLIAALLSAENGVEKREENLASQDPTNFSFWSDAGHQ